MIVHAAFAKLLATAPRNDAVRNTKTLGQTRLSAISKALREKMPA